MGSPRVPSFPFSGSFTKIHILPDLLFRPTRWGLFRPQMTNPRCDGGSVARRWFSWWIPPFFRGRPFGSRLQGLCLVESLPSRCTFLAPRRCCWSEFFDSEVFVPRIRQNSSLLVAATFSSQPTAFFVYAGLRPAFPDTPVGIPKGGLWSRSWALPVPLSRVREPPKAQRSWRLPEISFPF